MTKIYMIRHAQAEGNIYRRAHGQYDSGVSPKGRRQIEALAERFRDERIDALYSSDLRRAVQTAGAITKYHELALQTDPRLRELAIGVWEDVPFGNLEHADPEQMYNFNNDPAAWRAEGGESWAALQARMREAVTEIAARHPGQTVACVSHGLAIRALLAGILGVPSEKISTLPHGDNTSVSLLEAEGGALRAAWCNDAAHLPGELSTFARQSWWQEPGKPDPNNVRFQRLDPARYPSRYLDFYARTWKAVHGNLDGFHAALYRDDAIAHVKACPDALATIVRPDGEVVGITELDTERFSAQGVGWICLCFVEEACRRQLLGVQLVGHAVSVFRRLGLTCARLNVFEGNTGAIKFYESCGFRKVGESEGVNGNRLLIMEKPL